MLEQQHELQQQDDQQQVSFRKIEELESFGINKTDIVKLKSGGYHTIESVAFIYVIPEP
jgi:copper(I)-binding protein